MSRRLRLVAFAVACAGAAGGGAARADTSVSARAPDGGAKTGSGAKTGGCAKLPEGATLDEIVAPALRGGAPPTIARVLAWSAEVDDRPLYLDRALLWLARGDKAFELAHVYRHPRDAKTWHLSMVYDVPYESQRTFTAPPKRAALESFLTATWWHFAAEGGFRLVAAEVCREAWQASFGAPPWHQYGK